MPKKNMVIFASGRGSNAVALHDAVAAGTINADIKGLVCDIPGAAVMDRAREWGVPVILADRKKFASKQEFEQFILDQIAPFQADVICLAGFMRLLSSDFISQYEHKILNIHPALLPSFRGLHAQRQAVEAGVKIAGCTVHFVVPDMDAGPIIIQAAVPVLDGDTEDTLAARILEKEHPSYVQAAALFCDDKLIVNGNIVSVKKD
ncbi:phosphoribosylglycinamide formyltransferase [uncultured Megasphaera sp.]|uniref:phosphoribosylglycinamide formyltransferase n=1 Tax=uncultured Megasphaera sp. TaxID=165188 RepID=UPI0026585BB6|nr:phosphoribosylglycinamide formyltransferase [uncultured Megasphaera sp.]